VLLLVKIGIAKLFTRKIFFGSIVYNLLSEFFMKKRRRNIYSHAIDLTPLKIRNLPRTQLTAELERIAYKGYAVEDLQDGRKIVITKPGGKFTFGSIRREDFMVWIFNPNENTLWLISHKDIYQDLETKGSYNPRETIKVIDALQRVFNGEEPDDILKNAKFLELPGEPVETLLKAYKWIWGQEDVNYPNGLGRRMSFEGKKIEDGKEISTGEGILDIKKSLEAKLNESE
jgi:hypothetical protein